MGLTTKFVVPDGRSLASTPQLGPQIKNRKEPLECEHRVLTFQKRTCNLTVTTRQTLPTFVRFLLLHCLNNHGGCPEARDFEIARLTPRIPAPINKVC